MTDVEPVKQTADLECERVIPYWIDCISLNNFRLVLGAIRRNRPQLNFNLWTGLKIVWTDVLTGDKLCITTSLKKMVGITSMEVGIHTYTTQVSMALEVGNQKQQPVTISPIKNKKNYSTSEDCLLVYPHSKFRVK